MAGFHLYSSNRQELLVERLAEIQREQPLAGPLTPETIMVQNHGMQRWVSLELARLNGIEANTRYIFPNELLQLAFAEVVPGYQTVVLPEKETLVWTIMAILPSLLARVEFSVLRRYLEDGRPLKCFQLARRLAGLLDQYNMFRPAMLTAWEKGHESDWQALLWQALPQEVRERQKSVLRQRFFASIDHVLAGPHHLPERIFIFGISSLPPLHIEVLGALSKGVEIYLFFLNPTDQYWVDLLSDREISQKLDRWGRPAGPPHRERITTVTAEELYLETGNPLLASLGSCAREFFHLLIEQDLVDGSGEECFASPPPTTLLHRLQQDIFHLENPASRQGGKTILAGDDRSLQIHSCHSPMREVEILHDQLLYLLDTNPELQPSDIVVMTPDIDVYAPLIQSVFKAAGTGGGRIPFSIADYSMQRESKVIRYFLRLLEIVDSRFTVPDVFELLESESIRDSFRMTDEDVATVRQMILDANVRWGIDGVFRAKMSTPATYETTWQFGIDRILTGYALPGRETLVFQSILPFDDIEGSKAACFGRFLQFFERLKELVQPGPFHLETSRSLEEWAELLRIVLCRFFREDDAWCQEFGLLRTVLDELRENGTLELQVDIQVIAAYLRKRLEALAGKGGFLGFGVTFCSMMPMRAIPFEVIGLLGMNDRAFPRLAKPLSFDLMRKDRRPGDRSLKDEDRHLFLETILSSRKVLYISYVGQSIKDNTSLPCSTLVAELLSYIEQGYQVAERSIREFLITRHPLQPFHPAYFQQGTGLFSYSRENLLAARQLQQAGPRQEMVFAARLEEPGPEFLEVSVEVLVRFFDNPARFLFNQRLGVFLEEREEAVEGEEIFTLSPLARYGLQSRLLDITLQDGNAAAQKRIFAARGALPLARAGEVVFDSVLDELEDFSAEVAASLQEERLEPLLYDFFLQDYHFHGAIQCAYQNNLIRYRPSGIKIKDRLRIWVEQCILNYLRPPAYPRAAVLLGRDKRTGRAEILYCPPIERAEEELLRLLAYYWQGLTRPLAFFPRTAQKYMEALGDGNHEKARQKASFEWLGSDFYPGEMQQCPYFMRCFQHLDLFADTDFEKILTDLLGPVYAMQEERK